MAPLFGERQVEPGCCGGYADAGWICLQQVRVARRNLLPGAMKIMEIYAKMQGHELEVQFLGEEGTGTGPTLEFYTLLSHELQKRKLKMWRTEDVPMHEKSGSEMDDGEGSSGRGLGLDLTEHVYAPQGLFPRPMPQNKITKKVCPSFLHTRSGLHGRLFMVASVCIN